MCLSELIHSTEKRPLSPGVGDQLQARASILLLLRGGYCLCPSAEELAGPRGIGWFRPVANLDAFVGILTIDGVGDALVNGNTSPFLCSTSLLVRSLTEQ